MMRIAIVGYGNLGKGVELGLRSDPSVEIVGVFTRRNPLSVSTMGASVYPISSILDFKDLIDVCILCGGSKNDLPEQTPYLAHYFNCVDSFDTHALIESHQEKVNVRASEFVSIVSIGWDPGLFSLNRLMAQAVLPQGETFTFWGEGVSQGHSDAIRKIDGVKDAVQYTIPSQENIERVKSGVPILGPLHTRDCYVVLEEGVDASIIEAQIVSMPHYFAEYETSVHFIPEEILKKDHSAMPHGGIVIHRDINENGHKQVIEYRLNLESNPEFTAAVLIAYAKASVRMRNNGMRGAYNIFDIAPKYLFEGKHFTLL